MRLKMNKNEINVYFFGKLSNHDTASNCPVLDSQNPFACPLGSCFGYFWISQQHVG